VNKKASLWKDKRRRSVLIAGKERLVGGVLILKGLTSVAFGKLVGGL
jgi:hypothetical protein